MLYRPIDYILKKGIFNEIFRAKRRRVETLGDKMETAKLWGYFKESSEIKLPKVTTASKVSGKPKLEEWQKTLGGVNPRTGRSSLKVKVLAEENQFSLNYTQTYSAATKSNGGLRGSRATKGR